MVAKIIALTIILLSPYTFACNLQNIKNEVAKFHGPEWNALLPTCSKANIKKYLKSIIKSPSKVLSEYDQDQQKFLFRNAVKSYGHFAPSKKDVEFLTNLFNDDHGTVKKLFGVDAPLFRMTIMESIANTGNLEALSFFQSILEDENSILYLQQYAAEFATWVIEGSPFKGSDQLGGTLSFVDIFYPNISEDAQTRFSEKPLLLDQLKDKKEELEKITSEMLNQSEKYKDIKEALQKLSHAVKDKNNQNSEKTVFTQVKDSDGGPSTPTNLKENSHNSNREIASLEENSPEETEKSKNKFKIFSLIIMTSLLGFFYFRSRNQE